MDARQEELWTAAVHDITLSTDATGFPDCKRSLLWRLGLRFFMDFFLSSEFQPVGHYFTRKRVSVVNLCEKYKEHNTEYNGKVTGEYYLELIFAISIYICMNIGIPDYA